jgi:uncharacterized protein (UPF0335 family)
MIGRNTEAAARLTSYADRLERLQDDVDALKEDLKQVKAEAKADGFNVQALTRLVAIRRNKRRADSEAELLNDLALYAHVTGTPFDLAYPDEGEAAPQADAAAVDAANGRAAAE